MEKAETVNSGSAEPDQVKTCEGNKSQSTIASPPGELLSCFIRRLTSHILTFIWNELCLPLLNHHAANSAQAQHFIDTLEGTAFPNSKRIYITGSQPDIRIPMREIQLSPTLTGGSKDNPQFEENEAVPVYDTSGPYGDPDVAINVQQGWQSCASRGLRRVTIAKN